MDETGAAYTSMQQAQTISIRSRLALAGGEHISLYRMWVLHMRA